MILIGVTLFVSLQKQDDDAEDELEIAIDNTAFMDEFFSEVNTAEKRKSSSEIKAGALE